MHDGSAGTDTLIADLCLWGLGAALFDIRVIDTDAQSYCACSPRDVLGTADSEKCKHLQACQDGCATFTPLVSVDGMLGLEADF